MRLATAPPFSEHHNSLQFLDKKIFPNSMSEDYHFSFSNGFERSQEQQQHHIAQQIRRDKLRVQGFEPPPPLVGMEEPSALPVYETAGMLSEMFNFASGGAATATELLENQISHSYRNPRAPPPGASSADWFSNRPSMVGGGLGYSKNHNQQHHISSINADSVAAMQLFPSHPPPPTSSTLHMLLPNPSSSSNLPSFHTPSSGAFGQFTWDPSSGNENNPNEIPGVVEGQGLSLSLSSSLQAAKAEELRIGEGGMLFFGHSGGPTPPQYQVRNLVGGSGGALHLHGGVSPNHQWHVGPGSSLSAANILRNSKYAKAAQELLEEICSVGRGQLKKNKFGKQNNNNNRSPTSNPSGGAGGAGGNSSSSSKDLPLSASDRIEHQRRRVKLLSVLDEVDRRYNHYCEQMQMVVNSFDMVMGYGAAAPYTSLAQRAMSRHFRCLKDAVAAQLKHSCEMLGEKDAGALGVTKGETPRLRILEQSLRQQRAYHQMGMMEQEAWRPQRGLPERSVNILRAWLFEHFLHPYPSDADKHLLARQTGLSRNQVSNWFINARVRLWKPMIEEMYLQEAQEETEHPDSRDQTPANNAQIPTPYPTTTTATAAASSTTVFTPPSGKRSEINAPENDPSFVAINIPENQAKLQKPNNGSLPGGATSSAAAQSFPATRNAAGVESTVIRFGTGSGDVSLTLGLRHAGNPQEKSHFSVRDFGSC